MICFCADDYGVSKECNTRIENCFYNGVLNKISVLPNSEINDIQELIKNENLKLSLHINLVEGRPLSSADEIDLLVSKQGNFKYSFIGLFLQSLFGNRKKLEKQLYAEIEKQIDFWLKQIGDDYPLLLDGHQHTHMIPFVFKTLLKVIKDKNLNVSYLRIPTEPLRPYLLSPSLYLSYSLTGIIKQFVLNFFGHLNRKELKNSGINYGFFIGVLFSGKMTEKRILKILPHYLKLAEKHHKDIEVTLHPGYTDSSNMMAGCRKGFLKFYLSKWRKTEYDTLLNLKL